MALLDRLSRGAAALLALFILGLILAQVVGRLFGLVIPSANELAGFATAGLIFFGLTPTLRAGGHIRVRVLLEVLPPSLRRKVGGVAAAFSLAFGLYAAYAAWALVLDSYRFQDLAPGLLPLPMWVPQSLMALGLTVFVLALGEALIRAWREG